MHIALWFLIICCRELVICIVINECNSQLLNLWCCEYLCGFRRLLKSIKVHADFLLADCTCTRNGNIKVDACLCAVCIYYTTFYKQNFNFFFFFLLFLLFFLLLEGRYFIFLCEFVEHICRPTLVVRMEACSCLPHLSMIRACSYLLIINSTGT